MCTKDFGLESWGLPVLSLVLGVIVSRALSPVLAVKAYRLHADAAAGARDPAIDLSRVCARL